MNTGVLGREPVTIINAITAVIEASITLAIAFGLELSPAQAGALMAFVVAVGTLIQTVVVRSHVTPVADPRAADGQPLVPESTLSADHSSPLAQSREEPSRPHNQVTT